MTEHLSGMQAPAQVTENQSPAPPQAQEPTQEGAAHPNALSPRGHVSAQPPPRPSSSAPGIPLQAQDLAPNQKEAEAQQSDPSSNLITTALPENEARTREEEAGQVGPPSSSPSQGPPQHPDPPPAPSPQRGQDEESGEAEVAPSSSPPSEPPRGPGPTSLSPQTTQDEETESASLPPDRSHHDPPREASPTDETNTVGPSLGDPPQPLEEGTPKAEVRVCTPYPGVPRPQDPTNAKQSQGGDPVPLLPRSRPTPTRLPQPRVLAPLQSRRPTPKLPSPSREGPTGAASAPTVTPSPRAPPAQEGDPSKLPLISTPHSRPPQHPSPHPGCSPQQGQGDRVREVKLPLISPPAQEPAPQPAPEAPQEEGAQLVSLPRIPTPFGEQQLPQNVGARHDSRPAKERQVPKVGRSPSRRIPGVQASPPNPEPEQQTGARKKRLPVHRETAKGLALRKVPPGSRHTAPQPGSQSQPTRPRMSHRPSPSPPRSPQGTQRSRANTPEVPEPAPGDALPRGLPLQEEERGRGHGDVPPDDLVHMAAVSQKGPSLKSEHLGGLSQENKSTLHTDSRAQGGQHSHGRPPQNQKAPAEPPSDGSVPPERPRRGEAVRQRGRSQKGPSASDVPEQDAAAPTQQPVQEASPPRESSVQGGHASRQQTREKRTQRRGGAPQDKSPAVPPNQVSAEAQGGWTGRLRARGSQSTNV